MSQENVQIVRSSILGWNDRGVDAIVESVAPDAYVVSSNSQVGRQTISGRKPPTGKHANTIPGSINGGDVAANSLTGADVKESSLTGNAQALVYNSAANDLRKK